MKLALNKLGKGRYAKRSGNILVTVELNTFTNNWIGRIENITHTAKDVFGNDVEMGEEIVTFQDTTKTSVVRALKYFILEN